MDGPVSFRLIVKSPVPIVSSVFVEGNDLAGIFWLQAILFHHGFLLTFIIITAMVLMVIHMEVTTIFHKITTPDYFKTLYVIMFQGR